MERWSYKDSTLSAKGYLCDNSACLSSYYFVRRSHLVTPHVSNRQFYPQTIHIMSFSTWEMLFVKRVHMRGSARRQVVKHTSKPINVACDIIEHQNLPELQVTPFNWKIVVAMHISNPSTIYQPTADPSWDLVHAVLHSLERPMHMPRTTHHIIVTAHVPIFTFMHVSGQGI